MFKGNCLLEKTRVAVHLVYWLCRYWRCVRTLRVIMIMVMNCGRVAYDEFSCILWTLRMSFSLNPSIWPIRAFGSCSINRHLRFSYSLTQYIQSEMKQESYVSVMCYFPANVLTRHTQTDCVLCVGSQCVIARTDRRNGTQIGMCNFCIDQYILLYCWIDRHCWLSDTMTVFLVVLVQCAWHVSNCLVYC